MPNGVMPLSEREQEILRLVAGGLTNLEIARRLVISVNTVKVHLRNIFSKLGVESRTEATMWAVHQGLVEVKTPPIEQIEPEPDADVLPASAGASATEIAEPISLARRIFMVASAIVVLTLAFAPTALRSATPPRAAPASALSDSTTAGAGASAASTSRWTSRAQMPSARSRLAVAAVDQMVYAIGGDAGGQPSDAVEVYDPAHNLWQLRAPKPTAVSNIGAAVIGNQILVPGGLTAGGQPTAALEAYDFVADKWTARKPMPRALAAYAIAALDDRLYLFGGWNGSEYVGDVYSYDPARDEWQTGTPMSEPRGFAAAGVVGRKIYVVGGFDGRHESARCDEFDPAKQAAGSPWQARAPMSVGRGGLAVANVGQMLFAIGGGWQGFLAYNERYDPRINSWFSFESPITGQWRNLGLAAVGVKLYAVGGWSGDSLNSNEEYQALYRIVIPVPSRR